MAMMNQPGTEGQVVSRQYAVRYTLAGAIFGLAFPVLALAIFILVRSMPLNMASVLEAHRTEPLLWIIDTAPIFLGLFASLAGRREDKLQQSKRQLQALVSTLELRVAVRTDELQRAVEIGQQVNEISGLTSLLDRAAVLIRSSFGLYHAQIYLLDSASNSLVLRASAGPSGDLLLTRHYRPAITPGSISGTAVTEKRAVVVADTEHSPLYRANSLLPETRSQMMVPLIREEKVVGLLDVHSAEPGRLTRANVPVFQAIAGQLAVAIENARLLAAATRARTKIEAQARLLDRGGWKEFLNAIERGEHIGYSFDEDGLVAMEDAAAPPSSEGYLWPVVFAGEEVGTIWIDDSAHRPPTESDAELIEAVVGRVAQRIENLRLLAQADHFRSEAEAASRRLTRDGWDEYLDQRLESAEGYLYDRQRVLTLEEAENGDGQGKPTAVHKLRIRGETIGQLEVHDDTDLDADSAELVSAIGDQLSAHLENLRLSVQTEEALARTEEQARRLEKLNELGRELAAAKTLEEVYRTAAVRTRQVVDADRTSIAMLDASGETYQVLALDGEKGASEVGDRAPIGDSTIGTAVAENRVIIVPQTDDSGIPGIVSFMVAPLATAGRVIGTINVGSKRIGAYGPLEERLLLQIASLMASNIENRRLFEQTETALVESEEHSRRLGLLNEMAQELNQAADLRQMYYIAAGYTYHIVSDVDLASFALLDPSGNSFDLYELKKGHIAVTVVGKEIPLEGNLIGQVAEQRRLVNTPDITENGLFDFHDLAESGFRSAVNGPLLVRDRVVGVLNLASLKAGAFDRQDEQMLGQITALLSSAIEIRRLVDQVEARARREQILREVTAKVRRASDVDTVMRVAAQELGRALGRQSFVYLNDEEGLVGASEGKAGAG